MIAEFFESLDDDKSVRVILNLTNTTPRQSGEVHLFTKSVGKLRPMLEPDVQTFLENGHGHAWKATFLDPATDKPRVIHRLDYKNMKVDGIKLQRVDQSSTEMDDTRYLTTCRFVLFYGQVDEHQTIIVIRGVGGQGPWATMGEQMVEAISAHRHNISGSVEFIFPHIGVFYLPSAYAMEEDKERRPCLDHYTVNPLHVKDVDLSQLPGPPIITWDLLE